MDSSLVVFAAPLGEIVLQPHHHDSRFWPSKLNQYDGATGGFIIWDDYSTN
jgi:hypothetical protein